MPQVIPHIKDFLVSIYPTLYALALVVGWVFVISGTTDLFFDLFMMVRSIRRSLISRLIQPVTLQRLEAREQQKVAIFIAAWKESDVIGQTLMNACETIRYRNYDIFVGTYPNDLETQAEVDKAAAKNSHVHKVVTPDDGPTNKASNLNHVFQALQEHESRSGQYYDIIVMHDSEDVIHPYSLLVYNYLIPRMEMIQIPVFPMALPLRYATHWTYADEFAENHTKMMLVRELSGGFVPSAGVGTAFTKRAFRLLSVQHQNEVFSPNTLTEDYELGLRMNLSGIRASFVQIKIASPKSIETGKKQVSDWVATRAVFPTDFKRAVRQKTRWNIGIILQGWQNIGWSGPLAVKWNLFQDRKALITALVNFLAYFVFAYFLVYQILATTFSQQMPVLIHKGSMLWYLVLVSTIFMVWRSLNRAYAVNKIYSWLPALTSIPRVIWGNLINFCAIIRAVYQFTLNRFRHSQVAWDKTTHEFPDGVTEEGRAAAAGMRTPGGQQNRPSAPHDPQEITSKFLKGMENADESNKLALIKKISRENGETLFPHFIPYIEDPSWEMRSAVCRTLSFLRLPQALPQLEKAAEDADWVVRSNAVRAIGKLGKPGEEALMRLLSGPDQYAREAALTVLEQQGVMDRYLLDLYHTDDSRAAEAASFFETLANEGSSQLAREILKNHALEMSKLAEPITKISQIKPSDNCARRRMRTDNQEI